MRLPDTSYSRLLWRLGIGSSQISLVRCLHCGPISGPRRHGEPADRRTRTRPARQRRGGPYRPIDRRSTSANGGFPAPHGPYDNSGSLHTLYWPTASARASTIAFAVPGSKPRLSTLEVQLTPRTGRIVALVPKMSSCLVEIQHSRRSPEAPRPSCAWVAARAFLSRGKVDNRRKPREEAQGPERQASSQKPTRDLPSCPFLPKLMSSVAYFDRERLLAGNRASRHDQRPGSRHGEDGLFGSHASRLPE
jgi:hypothetical protein